MREKDYFLSTLLLLYVHSKLCFTYIQYSLGQGHRIALTTSWDASDLRWTILLLLGFTNSLSLWDKGQIEHRSLGCCPRREGITVLCIM